ncbi:uncharacterized protein ACBR49_005354 [Aulostomus maculatus]
MNLVKNTSMHQHLRDEEVLVVENAIRLAIDSIINVLYGVNSARSREYQRMVADRDKEIQRLECRLGEIEQDLQVLRQQGCSCGLFGSSIVGSQSPDDRQKGEQSGFSQDCMDAELVGGEQQCDMSSSLGLYARPPSHVSSQSLEAALPSSPSRLDLDQSCTSHSAEAVGVLEVIRNPPPSPPSSIIIKEEPCDIDTVLIKWEMSEERFCEPQQRAASPCHHKDSSSFKKKLENREGKRTGEIPQADLAGPQTAETEHLRNKKKSVPMSELPEEAQRLKRAAWRAASRRYYARKIARQQASPSATLHHHTNSQYSHPISFVDKRKRTLISELPVESQALQREAWRASSKRYYARKLARHQTEPTQYEQLLQNMEPPGDPEGTNGGGSHTSSGGLGGILCS